MSRTRTRQESSSAPQNPSQGWASEGFYITRPLIQNFQLKIHSKPSLPATSFSAKNAPKRLVVGLRPNPREEFNSSTKTLSAVGIGKGNIVWPLIEVFFRGKFIETHHCQRLRLQLQNALILWQPLRVL